MVLFDILEYAACSRKDKQKAGSTIWSDHIHNYVLQQVNE